MDDPRESIAEVVYDVDPDTDYVTYDPYPMGLYADSWDSVRNENRREYAVADAVREYIWSRADDLTVIEAVARGIYEGHATTIQRDCARKYYIPAVLTALIGPRPKESKMNGHGDVGYHDGLMEEPKRNPGSIHNQLEDLLMHAWHAGFACGDQDVPRAPDSSGYPVNEQIAKIREATARNFWNQAGDSYLIEAIRDKVKSIANDPYIKDRYQMYAEDMIDTMLHELLGPKPEDGNEQV